MNGQRKKFVSAPVFIRSRFAAERNEDNKEHRESFEQKKLPHALPLCFLLFAISQFEHGEQKSCGMKLKTRF